MRYNRQTKKEKESKQKKDRERKRVCHLWGLVSDGEWKSEREREGAS